LPLLISLLQAMRPKQWIKNLLVFAALIFAHQMDEPSAVLAAVAAFACFCALSASVYLVNDVVDIAQDRAHPTKRYRPIASGALPVPVALSAAAVLAPLGVVGCYLVNFPTGIVATVYLLLTLSYHYWLKHLVIVDVLTVAAGFVLRAVVGATAIWVEISPWLLICTLLLALFLALTKRRQEIVTLDNGGVNHRRILGEYSPVLLDQMISLVAASTLMSYCLYTIDERTVTVVGTRNLMYTIPFVIYGLFRYLYLVHQKGRGDAPDKVLLSDAPLLINVLLYVVAVVIILYLAS